jgi:hypothetical protein
MTRFIALLPLVMPALASAESPEVEDATALTGAIAAVLGQASLQWQYGSDARTCAAVTLDRAARTMTFDFTGCAESHDISGTVEIYVVSAQHLVATYQEDFVIYGHSVVGTFSAQALSRRDFLVTTADAAGAPTELVASDLDSDHLSQLSQLELHVGIQQESMQMYGAGTVLYTSGDDVVEGAVDLGAGGAEPLVWSRPFSQPLPQAGLLSLATSMALVLEIEIDPDDYTPTDNGQDDYETILVPAEAAVSGTFWVEFAETCEESVVYFTAEEDAVVSVSFEAGPQQVEEDIVIPAAEVEATVNAGLDALDTCPSLEG